QRPLAVLFIVWSIEAIVMKVRERQDDLVKVKLKRVTLHPDFQDAVSRMIVLASVIRERMRRLGVGNAAKPFLRSRFGTGLLAFQTNVEQAISPGRWIHAEQTLIQVVADRVVERCDVIANYEHDHADVFIRHERNLRVKA